MTHEYARLLLRKYRDDELKRQAAAQADLEYVQAQIDYDQTHEHSSKADIPKFEKRRDIARQMVEEHRKDVAALDAALKALGEPQS
jgi:hypothetical protein